MDTHAHARRIEHLFGLGNGSCGSVWVGAETEHFSSSLLASRTGARPMHVLFYGQFIPLHGVDTVIRPARLLRNEPVEWQILGQVRVAPCFRAILPDQPFPQQHWWAWVDVPQLTQILPRADVGWGIFA